jgi:AcrR family transcriptional regulator
MTESNRIRRTKRELTGIIWDAFERMVIKSGFNSVTLIDLAREAGVEPAVIYNRFEDTEDLFSQYIIQKDLWLNSSIQINPELSLKENGINLYCSLIDSLYENEIMQRILLWELNDTHAITRRIAQNREFENSFILAYLNKESNKIHKNLNVLNAMIISSIYYLILHKKISTFCTIDFNTQEGKEQLKETVKALINKMFEE